jgi:methionine synthase I (cobalamin-dependent)
MMSQNFNLFSFSSKIHRPLILDGSIGALLHKKGFVEDSFFWSTLANEKHPHEVIKLHKEYIKAGADIITTNTFRTNPAALKLSGKRLSDKYVKKAVKLAKEAITNHSVLVAGSNAPAEDCYQSIRILRLKEIEHNHITHINQLMENGCDFILNETQSHLDEIKIISDYCRRNGVPFVMSFFFDEKLKLLDGNDLREAVKYTLKNSPLAIGFNCITYEILINALSVIKFDYNWGYYLNCSKGNITNKIYSSGLTITNYIDIVKTFMRHSPSFIGSCCGSTPAFTKQIKIILDGSAKS